VIQNEDKISDWLYGVFTNTMDLFTGCLGLLYAAAAG
jgi:hypothetical protein